MERSRRGAESRSAEISVITEMSVLGPARDSELDHLRLESGSLHAEQGRCTGWTGYHPIGFLEGTQNMIAFRLVQRRNR